MTVLDAFKLDGQVAIVTGGGAGIGRGIAEMFAQAGAAVVVSDLKKATAAAVADSINANGGKAVAVACDVTNDDDLKNLIDVAISTFGQITILINNAGGGGPKPFDMPMDTFIWAYKLNVFSVFHLCQLCAPHMESAGGGAILNISSMAGDNKNKNMASYSSSKAAESHLTRNIAFDLGPKGIRVNAIDRPRCHQNRCPGHGAHPRHRNSHAETHSLSPVRGTQRHCLCGPVPLLSGLQLGEWAGAHRQRRRRARAGLGILPFISSPTILTSH